MSPPRQLGRAGCPQLWRSSHQWRWQLSHPTHPHHASLLCLPLQCPWPAFHWPWMLLWLSCPWLPQQPSNVLLGNTGWKAGRAAGGTQAVVAQSWRGGW